MFAAGCVSSMSRSDEVVPAGKRLEGGHKSSEPAEGTQGRARGLNPPPAPPADPTIPRKQRTQLDDGHFPWH